MNKSHKDPKEGVIMTHHISRLAVLGLALILFCIPSVSVAQEGAELQVDIAAICTNVIDREPVGTGISFPASVGQLFCFTRIINAQPPTRITHVWYYFQAERARVDLAVNSSTWRTYSSKIIQHHEIGSWHVDVLDSEGNVLKVIQFITTANGEPETAPEPSQAHKPVPEEGSAVQEEPTE